MTTHALAAKQCRAELKQVFPLCKFSVTSESFAGGTALRIRWDKVTGPSRNEVSDVVNKYQSACYDPYADYWDNSNKRDDIAQVSFVTF